MKSLMSLWSSIAEESAVRCCTSATGDINTASRRFEHEGLSFLTITLPDYGKSIQKWIDHGQVGPNPSFSTEKRGSGLPLFLGGFLGRVFDRSCGTLLDEPCIDSVIALRQLTLMFGKLSLPCSPARERAAMREYVECEHDVRQADKVLSQEDLEEFRSMSSLLFSEIFSQMDRDVYYEQVLPKHGPGAVADGLSSNGKYQLRSWTRRLEEVFPSYEYLIPNLHFREELDQVNIIEPGAELPVKVISVPKTLKTPRIIAVEPACMQYTQQALLRSFLVAHSRDELLCELIGFDDQSPNQALARQGSMDNRTATLDLSEASDRVSNQLVRTMLDRWPHLNKAIDATRSRRAEVPGHGVIRLAKYASMGSALCFPMEAMVFLTMIFLGIQRSLNAPMTKKDIKSFRSSVRVYGDDLVVPVDHVLSIVQVLEHFGARVGLDKSFWTGKFRESCGKEFLNGHDVSLVRVRQALPYTIADASGVISAVSLRNQLYTAGYFRTASLLDDRLEKILTFFPVVDPSSPVLGRVSYESSYQVDRMHPFLHSPLVRGYVVKAKAPIDELGDTGALLKCLLRLEYGSQWMVGSQWDTEVSILRGVERHLNLVPCYTPSLTYSVRSKSSSRSPTVRQDGKHLERSGRPKRVGIKLGWWSPK
jgi:hypothetical protein